MRLMPDSTHPPTEVKPEAPAAAVKARGKPSDEGRFIWLSSLAVERIINELGQTQAAYGISVYVALCRLSSREKNNPQIQATVSKIAGMARLGYRKTFEILTALEAKAKVVGIEPGKRSKGEVCQPPNTYTLLSSRLHNGKSGRLHNGKSAGCTGRTPSHAENPKELLPEVGVVQRTEQRRNDAASPQTMSGVAASSLCSGLEVPTKPRRF
jgi:hypothetical protein